MARGLLTLNGSSDLAGALAKQIAADVKREENRIAAAHKAAATEVAEKFKAELRADLRRMGAKLPNTWRSRVYMNDPLSPTIFLWNTAPQIVDAFSLGVPIRAANGKFLAVPVGRAKAIMRSLRNKGVGSRSRDGGGRFIAEDGTVDRVAAQLGERLHYVPPRGSRLGELRGRRGHRDEVLFILIKWVKPPVLVRGRLSLPALSARVAQEFAAALAKYA